MVYIFHILLLLHFLLQVSLSPATLSNYNILSWFLIPGPGPGPVAIRTHGHYTCSTALQDILQYGNLEKFIKSHHETWLQNNFWIIVDRRSRPGYFCCLLLILSCCKKNSAIILTVGNRDTLAVITMRIWNLKPNLLNLSKYLVGSQILSGCLKVRS